METKFLYDDTNEALVIQNAQDVSPIIKDVQKLRDAGGKGKDMWHLGRIPEVIVEKYCTDAGITFRDFIMDKTHINRIMNDADYQHFRILG